MKRVDAIVIGSLASGALVLIVGGILVSRLQQAAHLQASAHTAGAVTSELDARERRETARPAPRPPRAAPAERVIDTSQSELLAAYAANGINADARFKNRLIRLSGTIDAIDRDVLGNPFLTFQADGFERAQCLFRDAKPLSGLRSGQQVTIVGRCAGKFGFILVRDCRID